MQGELLKTGQSVRIGTAAYVVRAYIGAGGQGEVWRVSRETDGREFALKLYYRHTATPSQEANLRRLVDRPVRDARFLWPLAFTALPAGNIGYVMDLRPPEFSGMTQLLRRTIEPGYRELFRACWNLGDAMREVHAAGLCYRDVSFGNVFLNPANGDIRICDNDNIAPEGERAEILGTQKFMAPEIVTGRARPSAKTDLHSLVVLMFYLLVRHHPLEGKLESDIRCLDAPAHRRLYGEDPLFIFDPDDRRNMPVKHYPPHQNPLECWPVLPRRVRGLFETTFGPGLRDPNARVRFYDLCKAFREALQEMLVCPACKVENFASSRKFEDDGQCWHCRRSLPPPMVVRWNRTERVLLLPGRELWPSDLGLSQDLHIPRPVARVETRGDGQGVWGLLNLDSSAWVLCPVGGQTIKVPPGKRAKLAADYKLLIGQHELTVEGPGSG